MRAIIRTALLTAGVVAAVLSSAVPATAAPANAPDRLVGVADCGTDGMFSFVVNSGNAHGTTWNPAFGTSSTGARAVFHPASVELTLTSPFGSDAEIASKPGAPGPVSCAITGSPAGFPQATLSGTVTGSITWLG